MFSLLFKDNNMKKRAVQPEPVAVFSHHNVTVRTARETLCDEHASKLERVNIYFRDVLYTEYVEVETGYILFRDGQDTEGTFCSPNAKLIIRRRNPVLPVFVPLPPVNDLFKGFGYAR